MCVSLDDAPWKNRPYTEEDRRRDESRRLMVSQFIGGALQLVKCPTCYALLEEGDLPLHNVDGHHS
jgi:hypothetical protein